MKQLDIFKVDPRINEFQLNRAKVKKYARDVKFSCVLAEIPKHVKCPGEGRKWESSYEEWEMYTLAIWRYERKILKNECTWEMACELFNAYRDRRVPAPLLITFKNKIKFKPEFVVKYLKSEGTGWI